MDINWLKDYIALVEYGNFTKAAESRFVTQPAFSRRIKSLENWLGVELVNRSAYPLKLTALGGEYLEPMKILLRDTYGLRTEMQNRVNRDDQLVVSTQHSLGVTYCPKWYALIKPFLGRSKIRIEAENMKVRVSTGDMHDCLEVFLSRRSDFLLCYHTPSIYPELEKNDLRKLVLEKERLVPVCATDKTGKPLYNINDLDVLPMVSFTPDSFFGDIILRECIPFASESLEFRVVYETALSDAIKSMVEQGEGMAWLPSSLVAKELEAGMIVQMKGLSTFELTIMLYAHDSNNRKLIVDFWAFLEQTIADHLQFI